MTPVEAYAWRRLDLEGTTLVVVDAEADDDRIVVEGQEVCVEGPERWATRFTIVADRRWRHVSTDVEVLDRDGSRHLRLDDLDGCDVVDLAGNPFTNAFVTRTRDVPVGATTTVRAAYVETPALTVRPFEQRYRRLAERRWEYADDEYGALTFDVDADGIVTDYEGLATRLG